jgi:predicted N-acetyltransferase YhbS
MVIQIRHERPEDIPAIRDINKRAFDQDQEANIVEALRANGAVRLSLMATLEDRVLGHILYSPAKIGALTGAGLGPHIVKKRPASRHQHQFTVQFLNRHLLFVNTRKRERNAPEVG